MWRLGIGGIFGWASECSCSPDLKIERNDARNRAAELDRRFAGQRFAQNLNGSRSGTAVDHVDLGEWRVRQLFVVPENCGRWHEEADVEAIVAALAIQKRDQLIETRGAAAAE